MIVTLIPRPDFAPVPRVEVRLTEEAFTWDGGSPGGGGVDSFDGGDPSTSVPVYDAGTPLTVSVDIPDDTDAVTVWRSSQGRSLKVRGGVGRAFSGSFGLLDLEAGFNVASTYEVECFEAGASVARIPLGSVTLPWIGPEGGVLVQQPLSPRLHAVVTNLQGSWPSVQRTAPGGVVYTQGSSYPSVVGFGPRHGITGAAVEFGAPSREVAAAVWATLGDEVTPQLPIWLVRAHQGLLPRVFFGKVDALEEVDQNSDEEGWSTFVASLTEVAPPAPALLEAPLRYSDLAAVFPTYSALKAALPRYSQVNTAFEYAGAGGA